MILGSGPTEPVSDKRSVIFAPFIVAPEQLAGQGEPTGVAAELFAYMAGDPHQGRKPCLWHDLLAQVAESRAKDLATRGYFSHETPDGKWPNGIVRAAGYRLPDWYPSNGNNVESLAAGYGTPEEAWQAWLHSDVHRRHVLAETPFFSAQVNVGMGYYKQEGSVYLHYWCCISAPAE